MKLKLPDMTKWKVKLPSRIDCERLLIVGAAALVVVLALRGGEEPKPPWSIPRPR